MQQSSCQEFVIQGGVGALDEDLLAALDDVLSLADAAPVADAFNVVADETPLFGDELDGILAIEAEALLATDEGVTTDKSTTSASRPSVSRSNIAKSPQGATSLAPGKKGKDVRAAPYSKTNKPRRRKRPKDELDYLRAKVADMEEELASLQTKPDVGSPSRIAERQKKEADRSVVENMRLRAMLEGQLNVARSLEAAIDQHQRDAAQSLPTFNGSGTAGAPQPDVMTDELVFALLNESLESQIAEIDTVFELSGIAHVNRDMNNGTKVHQDPNGVSVRHEDVRLLPFSSEAVHRTMWGILRYSTAKEMMLGPFKTEVVGDNRMNVTMIEKIQVGSAPATNSIRRFAFRRVFEKNRTVVVWSSYVEMDGSVFVRLREKGYCTTSPFSFGSTSSDSVGVPGSITRMAIFASPEMTGFASSEDQKAHIGEMTELVVGTYRVTMGLMHQMIDTLLLREAMGGKVVSPGGGTVVAT
ncbi:uncharacterized protein IUM83_18887 [Phytophthora cinnamomi]|uniref:uncharacterized protein n=1 Tax=Phytophthora cinnamomi TaxID=4785 RepID=UPI00355A116D|nr:hypothetical protein IUM83_18887 [Phytophthora cinnamomi]